MSHGMAQHCTAWNSITWHGTMSHGMAQYHTAWHNVTWHSTALHGMAQCYTAWHSVTWHGTAPWHAQQGSASPSPGRQVLPFIFGRCQGRKQSPTSHPSLLVPALTRFCPAPAASPAAPASGSPPPPSARCSAGQEGWSWHCAHTPQGPTPHPGPTQHPDPTLLPVRFEGSGGAHPLPHSRVLGAFCPHTKLGMAAVSRDPPTQDGCCSS